MTTCLRWINTFIFLTCCCSERQCWLSKAETGRRVPVLVQPSIGEAKADRKKRSDQKSPGRGRVSRGVCAPIWLISVVCPTEPDRRGEGGGPAGVGSRSELTGGGRGGHRAVEVIFFRPLRCAREEQPTGSRTVATFLLSAEYVAAIAPWRRRTQKNRLFNKPEKKKRFYGCPEVHLDQVWRFLSVQGVFGQLVSAGHPGVSEDLTRSQSPMGVHMQHLRHQILMGEETFSKPAVLPCFTVKTRFFSSPLLQRKRSSSTRLSGRTSRCRSGSESPPECPLGR